MISVKNKDCQKAHFTTNVFKKISYIYFIRNNPIKQGIMSHILITFL